MMASRADCEPLAALPSILFLAGSAGLEGERCGEGEQPTTPMFEKMAEYPLVSSFIFLAPFAAPETADNAQALLSHNLRFAAVGDFWGYTGAAVLP